MKRFILLVITFFTLSIVTFASFPVTKNITTEVVTSDDSSDTSDPNPKTIGILLGVFGGIFGVLIAYAMEDDVMIKWAWKGFIWATVISLIIYFTFVAALYGSGLY